LIFKSCGAQLLFQIVLAPTIHPSDLPIVFASSYSESAAVGPVQQDRRGMLRKPLKVEKLKAPSLSKLLNRQAALQAFA
jgi:hypothetical protein